MTRRRFTPRSEDLEARELLSGLAAPATTTSTPAAAEVQGPAAATGRADAAHGPMGATVTPAQEARPVRAAEASQTTATSTTRPRITIDPDDPTIAPLRRFKIERLPNVLLSVRTGRFIPPEIVTALQEDLTQVAGRLKPPPSPSLQAFNLQLRSTLSGASVSVEDAAALNRIFGMVLERAGAPPETVAKFQADMLALAHVDIRDANAAQLLANDYATVLQTTMGVGIDFAAFKSVRGKPQTLPVSSFNGQSMGMFGGAPMT